MTKIGLCAYIVPACFALSWMLVGCPAESVLEQDDDVLDDDTGDDDVLDDDAGDDDSSDDDTSGGETYGPALYPADRTHSPISPYAADMLRTVAEQGTGLRQDVFMKVGDSLTVSNSALFCFETGAVDLGDHADLGPTLEFFLAGDAAGTTPFGRESAAAEVGMSAGWALSGSPSPFDTEVTIVAPHFALLQYGTNDMELGTTHESALWGFYENMTALLDSCIDLGIVPLLMEFPIVQIRSRPTGGC